MEANPTNFLKRTLYLTAKNNPSLTLDGPSLLITEEASAPRRFPLRILRQVVVQGTVTLPSPLLEQCLRHGISITWLESSGEPLGFFWPAVDIPAALNERLELFWERSDWHWKYENWRRAQERRALQDTLSALQLWLKDLRPEQAERVLLRILERQGVWNALPWRIRFLRGLLLNLVQERFLALGVTLQSLERRTAAIQIPEDFMRLLFWQYHADLYACAPAACDGSLHEFRRQSVAFVEQRRARDELRFLRLLDRFDHFLGGLR